MAEGEFWIRSDIHWMRRLLLAKMAKEDPISGYDFGALGYDIDDALDLELLVR